MTATLTVQRNLNFINAKDHKAQGDGTTDDTVAIAAAMTAANGGPVWLPKGTYKITSPLLFSLAGSGLWGAGIGATILQIAASFSGSAAISATAANKCSIRDMSIVGISSTYSNNPASDAIKINHCNDLETTNVFMQYINGWGIEVISDATADSYFPRLSNLHTSACKQGCHLQGTASPDFNMGAFLANCNFENCQAGDALFIEDVHDVTVNNLEGYSIATGSAIHVKGATSALFINNADVGGLVSNNASPTPTVLIEASAVPNYPSQIAIANSIIEDGLIGLKITDGSQYSISNNQFIRNGTDGIQLSGGVDGINIYGNMFNLNGYTAGSGHYDLNTTSTGKIFVHGNIFLTPGGSGSSQVESAMKTTTGTTEVIGNKFAGAAAFVNTFPSMTRSNLGYNPVGPLTAPGIPSSGTALQNPFGVDCSIYIDAGTVSAIAIGNSSGSQTATGLLSAASGISLFIAAGQWIKLTYTVAPTWTWFGL